MRTFLAIAIMLCIAGGVWLVQGPDFYWPGRGDPSLAIHLSGLSSRLLGAGLLATAALGVMAVRQGSQGRIAGPRSQYVYFTVAMLAVALIASAIWLGEIVPNPESNAAQATNQPKP